MSRSSHCGYPREKIVKFFGKRTGWYGEQCWSAHGRRWIKKRINKINRIWLKNQTIKELSF